MDDSLMMHIWCLHGDLHKDKKKYKAWIYIFLTWWWVTYILLLSYAHTVMMQALLWIRIVAIDDVKKFCQMSLSSRYIVLIHRWLLKVALLETWWWVLIYMILTYVDWYRCPQLMIHGWYWWDGYDVLISIGRHTLLQEIYRLLIWIVIDRCC